MFNINDYDLDNWNGREFYEYILEQYNHAAIEADVDYADVYLNAEDSNAAYFAGLNWDNKLFLELILHAQNRTGLKNVINWDVRKIYIQIATCNFNPQSFLDHYHISPNDDSIYRNNFVECSDALFRQIKDDIHIVNYTKPVKDFIKYIIYYAVYIVRKYVHNNIDANECRETFYSNLLNLYHNNIGTYLDDVKTYLDREITFGYNVSYGYQKTLICDLLKESGSRFNFLVKPDVHIRSAFEKIFDLESRYQITKNDKNQKILVANDGQILQDFEVVEGFTAIIQTIRNQYGEDFQEINAYKLDKMIFILCNDAGFYSIGYNGRHYSSNHNFAINKESLLNHINTNFKINRR